MDSVVATASGYPGIERTKLAKLIDYVGAHFVGSISESVTHLVCWKFEGRKFDIATRLNTIIVNHRWVEDCIKQGMRLPEEPYTLQSGQEVGPLTMEVPHVAEVGVSKKNKKHKLLSDESNTCDGSPKQSGDTCLETSGNSVWNSSSFLNENVFPDINNLSTSQKSKRKPVRSNLGKKLPSSSRNSIQESTSSELLRNQRVESSSNSSMDLVRDKRKSFNGNGRNKSLSYSQKNYVESSSHSSIELVRDKRKSSICNERNKAETSRKGRRLVKKMKNKDTVDLCSSDSSEECNPVRVNNSNYEDVSALFNHVNEETHDNVLENGRTSSDGFSNCRKTRNDGSKVVVDGPICIDASMDLNVHVENVLSTAQRTSEDGCSGADNSDEDTAKGLDITQNSEINSLKDLSCVICWADYSSFRGVLPCGHRFCYSCIKEWADCMALRRKISTCPLCKTSFCNIIQYEDTATTDQKIYSQTVPCGLSTMDLFKLHDQDTHYASAQVEQSEQPAAVCIICCRVEPVDLLITCNVCQIRCIHSYCLDPPINPWTCMDCKDLQRLYLYNR
ncbi:uncharacterized protein LOC133817792 isoform X2 [Humulus lupulus]|uniref:uncharacterized protein LOC133817792 isoform X2 n=1 Tax=Humulus lupulus TaxID=3486 RepID=UPI002B40EDCB|nr:uncharacterized protein LOC133817792 isoform X2 [Humulus lupulus]